MHRVKCIHNSVKALLKFIFWAFHLSKMSLISREQPHAVGPFCGVVLANAFLQHVKTFWILVEINIFYLYNCSCFILISVLVLLYIIRTFFNFISMARIFFIS